MGAVTKSELKITVAYLGLTRNVVGGKSEEDVAIKKGMRVRDLLESLSAKYGERFRNTVFHKGGTLGGFTRILLDGKNINELQGLESGLEGVAKVSIFGLGAGIAGG